MPDQTYGPKVYMKQGGDEEVVASGGKLTIEAGGQIDASLGTVILPAGSVTKAKAAIFVSIEQTGTGAPQNIAHGLAAVPAAVFIAPTDLTPATVGQYSVVEGAHDATNVIVTVTTGKKFKVWAMA